MQTPNPTPDTPKTHTIDVAYPSGHVLVVDAGAMAELSVAGFRRLRERIRAITPRRRVIKQDTRAGELLIAPVQSPTADCAAHVVREDGVPVQLILDLDSDTPEPGTDAIDIGSPVPTDPSVLVGHADPRTATRPPASPPHILAARGA
jgi:hypothetical protein